MSILRPNEKSLNNMEQSKYPASFIPSRIHEAKSDNSRNFSADEEKILKNISDKKANIDIFADQSLP
jgi:hypothetical protein